MSGELPDDGDVGGLSRDGVPYKGLDVDPIEIVAGIKRSLMTGMQPPLIGFVIEDSGNIDVRAILRQIINDPWLNKNAIVVCFDNASFSGTRHIAFSFKCYRGYWENDPEPKKFLRTPNITTYLVADFFRIILANYGELN